MLPAPGQDGVRFGDNDNLAALTAVQLEAGGVFLFTDVDYLYTANPNVDPAAEPMKVWAQQTHEGKKHRRVKAFFMKELRIIPPWDVFLFWIRHCCETRFENLLRIIGCSNRAEYKHFLFILCSLQHAVSR